MNLDAASPELRDLAVKVFKVVELLTGEVPTYHEGSKWYKFGTPIVAWFKLIGPKASKNPANSILVTATRVTDELEESSEQIGNNMFGNKTPEYVVQCNDPISFAGYLEFIGRAYKARHQF